MFNIQEIITVHFHTQYALCTLWYVCVRDRTTEGRITRFSHKSSFAHGKFHSAIRMGSPRLWRLKLDWVLYDFLRGAMLCMLYVMCFISETVQDRSQVTSNHYVIIGSMGFRFGQKSMTLHE